MLCLTLEIYHWGCYRLRLHLLASFFYDFPFFVQLSRLVVFFSRTPGRSFSTAALASLYQSPRVP